MTEAQRENKIKEILSDFQTSDKTEKTDEFYMKAALALARQAAEEGEVPVGCVIVRDGEIVTGDYNGRETFRDALYHAESSAIHGASKILGGWRLTRCTLYVTLEPCPMCAGAIINSRITKLFYGGREEHSGSCGSVINLFMERYGHSPQIVGGILEDECIDVLKKFFEKLR